MGVRSNLIQQLKRGNITKGSDVNKAQYTILSKNPKLLSQYNLSINDIQLRRPKDYTSNSQSNTSKLLNDKYVRTGSSDDPQNIIQRIIAENTRVSTANPSLVPVKKNGKIIGYRDNINQQSIRLSDADAQAVEGKRYNTNLKNYNTGSNNRKQKDIIGGIEPENKPDISSSTNIKPERSFYTETENTDSFKYKLSKIRFDVSTSDSFKSKALKVGAGFGFSLLSTGTFIKNLFTNPIETTKEVGQGLKVIGSRLYTGKGFPEIGNVLRNEPLFSLGFVGGEVATVYAMSSGIDTTTKLTKNIATRISPKYLPVTDGKIITKAGKIKIAGGTKTVTESIPKQSKLAGQKVTAVSAQRSLFNPLKKSIVVDKPLPTPNSPILEKSFFADPRGRLRTSRLGLVDTQKKAGIVDILSGDVTFSKTNPQAIIFEDVKIAKFPSYLSKVESKLKSGKTLTATEEAKLIKWQNTPTGEFKPVGFLSKESEITLAPGETIIKESRLGTTIIQGERVGIFETKVSNPNNILQSVNKENFGISLGKKTNIKSSSLSSSEFISKPYISVGVSSSPLINITKSVSSYKPSSRRSSLPISSPVSINPISSPISHSIRDTSSRITPNSPSSRKPSISNPYGGSYGGSSYNGSSYNGSSYGGSSGYLKTPGYITSVPKFILNSNPKEGLNMFGSTKSKKERKYKYLPSLSAIDYKVTGRMPKRLTGLEVRPIIKV